ncbi:uncharacterized protein M421DRAFT_191317 [Didymella exigua CBS 183.55]|uniref:Uncharacterized protein n=1 Tax=Didymella exigua CBS 183.55 TaxID=1150837 RepID=A0A6A5S151_9PLEO|nr:uncharacterized protein M421DRAFT_191317 [Didymella exigua CBS 183.55]KAF1933174.1 hypothetical protein M421DRAFT_191317 [Didymella exigua CBS 183.55]
MNDSDDSDSVDSLPDSSASDISTSSDDGSDDEPLISKLANWRAAQRSPFAATSSDPSRKRSVSSDESDAQEPSSASDMNYSDKVSLRGGQRTGDRPVPHDSDRSDGEPLILKKRRWRTAQQGESATDSSNTSGVESKSENDEPLVPVFSKWKAARLSRASISSPSRFRRRPVVESSSSDEDTPLTTFSNRQTASSRRPPPVVRRLVRLPVGTTRTRRRPVVLNTSKSD